MERTGGGVQTITPSTSTLHLICGLPGSGKTTLAKQLEHSANAVRFCPDEWIATLMANPYDRLEQRRIRPIIQNLQWQTAKRLLALGQNVILDYGFWSRQERDKYRSEAQALGVCVELHFLNLDRAELIERLAQRNANLSPGTFPVTPQELNLYASWFEPPTAPELAEYGCSALK